MLAQTARVRCAAPGTERAFPASPVFVTVLEIKLDGEGERELNCPVFGRAPYEL